MSSSESQLRAKGIKISVIGLGFVGSAIAAAWLRAGSVVYAFDVSADRVESLKRGESLAEEKIREAFRVGSQEKRLYLSSKDDFLRESDIKFICVPVYYTRERNSADLSFLEIACKTVGHNLKKGDSVVVCPSVPPGTTRNVVLPILESENNLVVKKYDFSLVYSPERIFVGRAVDDIETRYPAIISGLNDESLDRAESIFLKIAKKGVIKMPTLEAAELEKLAEGVYRDVNIALANELALISDELGIDFWKVREAANSQPFCQIHTPSFGVGGACIPVYPWFVANSVKKTQPILIKSSRRINDSMVEWLVDALETKFSVSKKTKILVLGLAFRKDVTDSRLSPTYRLVSELQKRGIVSITVHDPIITMDRVIGPLLTNDLERALEEADIAVLATDHSAYETFDWNEFAKRRQGAHLILIDGKGVFRNKVVNGIEIFGLGTGKNNPGMQEK